MLMDRAPVSKMLQPYNLYCRAIVGVRGVGEAEGGSTDPKQMAGWVAPSSSPGASPS